jgi:hypothetical protein
MRNLFVLMLLFSTTLLANEAKVLSIRGFISFNGKTLNKESVITKKGILKTGAGSYIKLKMSELNSVIIIGPNSEMNLEFGNEDGTKNTRLLGGLARWISQGKSKKQRGFRTKQAVMGVRGTDYLVKVTPLLGETEIIVFDGKVNFGSELDTSDKKELKKHQWGGIGGRFGQSIGQVLDLPKNVIDYFDSIIPNT